MIRRDASDEDDTLAALSSVSHSLSAIFPLPFRILVLVSLGTLCWALNLHVLHLIGIDTAAILDVRSPTNANEHIHPSKLFPPVYQLAACLAAWTGLCWILGFKVIAGGDGEAATGKAIAAMSLFLAIAMLFLPADRLKRVERMMLVRSLKRTATDSIFRSVPFCDVILADILTSLARVLGDLWVSFCSVLFITRNEDDILYLRYKDFGVPFITALPYMFRFRQCIAEYMTSPVVSPSHPALHSSGNSTLQIPGSSASSLNHSPGYQPSNLSQSHKHQPSSFVAPSSASSTPASPRTRALYNALKYATAFPVIFFSALQNGRDDPYNHPEIVADVANAPTAYFSSMTLFRIWVASVLVNSLYSFWWDVTNDWGLHMLLPRFSRSFPFIKTPESGTLLRRTMLLPDPMIYYLVVMLDIILRFTWSLRLSSHLHAIHELEFGIFLLEALEMIRRWVWVYVRIEWEAVRKGGDTLEERLRLRQNDSDMDLPIRVGHSSSPVPSPQIQQQQQQQQSQKGGVGLDRRISAGHRKTGSGKLNDLDSTDDEMGMGRSGILVELPKR